MDRKAKLQRALCSFERSPAIVAIHNQAIDEFVENNSILITHRDKEERTRILRMFIAAICVAVPNCEISFMRATPQGMIKQDPREVCREYIDMIKNYSP